MGGNAPLSTATASSASTSTCSDDARRSSASPTGRAGSPPCARRSGAASSPRWSSTTWGRRPCWPPPTTREAAGPPPASHAPYPQPHPILGAPPTSVTLGIPWAPRCAPHPTVSRPQLSRREERWSGPHPMGMGLVRRPVPAELCREINHVVEWNVGSASRPTRLRRRHPGHGRRSTALGLRAERPGHPDHRPEAGRHQRPAAGRGRRTTLAGRVTGHGSLAGRGSVTGGGSLTSRRRVASSSGLARCLAGRIPGGAAGTRVQRPDG